MHALNSEKNPENPYQQMCLKFNSLLLHGANVLNDMEMFDLKLMTSNTVPTFDV